MDDISKIMYTPEGEFAGNMYQGDKLVRKKTTDYLKDTVEIMKENDFVKGYTKSLLYLGKRLSTSEMNMVFYFLQYISYESGALKHPNGKLLTRSFIASDLKLSERSVDRALQGLKTKKVISHNYIGKEVQYFVNPWIFMKGKRINKTLYDMFKNSEWAKLNN